MGEIPESNGSFRPTGQKEQNLYMHNTPMQCQEELISSEHNTIQGI